MPLTILQAETLSNLKDAQQSLSQLNVGRSGSISNNLPLLQHPPHQTPINILSVKLKNQSQVWDLQLKIDALIFRDRA